MNRTHRNDLLVLSDYKWAAKWQIRYKAHAGPPLVTTVSGLTSFVAAP
jgi:hypothetical protein